MKHLSRDRLPALLGWLSAESTSNGAAGVGGIDLIYDGSGYWCKERWSPPINNEPSIMQHDQMWLCILHETFTGFKNQAKNRWSADQGLWPGLHLQMEFWEEGLRALLPCSTAFVGTGQPLPSELVPNLFPNFCIPSLDLPKATSCVNLTFHCTGQWTWFWSWLL